MTDKDLGKSQLPTGLSLGEELKWLHEHYLVNQPEAGVWETPVPDPNWYEHLLPVTSVELLTPQMFGVVDNDNTKYGWAVYNPLSPDNRRVQERAAVGLLNFTHDKENIGHLMDVYQSLEADGYPSRGFYFRPPVGTWDQLPAHLREFRESGDVKGAANYTARFLFSPWR